MAVRYVSRDEWEAGVIGAGYAAPHSQFTGLAVHHTVMVMPDYDRDGFLNGDIDDVKRYMRQLQVSRPDLGLEVPYSWVVFPGASDDDCIVAEGRGFGRTGAHTAGQNSSRYGVAFAGNASVSPATDGVIDGIRWVGSALANPGGARPTVGHRDLKATECPGNHLYARLGELQPPFTRASQEDDMSAQDVEDIKKDLGRIIAQLDTNNDKGFSARTLASLRRLENDHRRGVLDAIGSLRTLLTPFGTEWIDRAGAKHPQGAPGSSEAPTWVRWVIELVRGDRPTPPEPPAAA